MRPLDPPARPMAHAWSILIEVTNACRLRCAHCTEGVPHVRRPHFMSLDQLDLALRSLQGWKKAVGCLGGEPTLHPQFPEVCALFRHYFPKRQLALWTCGGPAYEQHRQLIDRTFAMVSYNDHQSPGFHKPIMVAGEEVVRDEEALRTLIANCFVPLHWSPLITHRGAFFCEVAATMDNLFDGPGGHPLEPGWWRKDFSAFAYQREHHCRRCSMPLPIETLPDNMDVDCVSPGNAERLVKAGSPLAVNGRLRVINEIDVTTPIRRNPRWFATPGTEHYWTRLSVQSGFWLAAQYRYVPGVAATFARDLARFAALKVAYTASRITATARRAWRGGAAAPRTALTPPSRPVRRRS